MLLKNKVVTKCKLVANWSSIKFDNQFWSVRLNEGNWFLSNATRCILAADDAQFSYNCVKYIKEMQMKDLTKKKDFCHLKLKRYILAFSRVLRFQFCSSAGYSLSIRLAFTLSMVCKQRFLWLRAKFCI